MNDTFSKNMKMMMQIAAKAASTHPECPVGTLILDRIIKDTFEDAKKAEDIKLRFGKFKDGLGDKYKTLVDENDRYVFSILNLFPPNVYTDYPAQAQWFTDFLHTKADKKITDALFRFLRVL